LEKVSKDCKAKLDWLNTVISEINDQPKHVSPKVTAAQIAKERETLFFSVNPILTRPKPAPPKKEEEKKEGEGEKTEVPAAEPEKKESEMDVD
jgi:heat shock protein 4